jgi:C1A family cysteine protease
MSLAFETGHEKESYIFSKFQEFLVQEDKKYSTMEEYLARFEIFRKNYERMEAFTLSEDKTYSVGINKFSDMTPQEFRRTYLNLNINILDTLKAQSGLHTIEEFTAPEAHDWREHGAVSKVKDQGSCGSCWAFSTVGNLEGVHYLKHKTLTLFSEQQLVDCDKRDQGCEGGLMANAYEYLIHESKGIVTQEEYKYTGRGGNCKAKDLSGLMISGYKFAPSQDEEEIKEFLYTTGPLAIALNADTLMFYREGIINDSAAECDPEGLNHGVTLVGYGSENGQDFWIVKNSWGPTWGEKGYFRMARGKGTCGVNTYVCSATLE